MTSRTVEKQPQYLSTVFSHLAGHQHHLEGAGPTPRLSDSASLAGVEPQGLNSYQVPS